jgi:hypothetical protein
MAQMIADDMDAYCLTTTFPWGQPPPGLLQHVPCLNTSDRQRSSSVEGRDV